jgi:catechol 2,3-dioxygenase-like lactoylglutathione lyase family enzyme
MTTAWRRGRAGAATATTLAVLLLASPAQAQIAPANAAGVAMGHLHVQVPDVEASAAFWTRLGGTRIVVDGAPAVKFPGMLILLSRGTPTGLSEGAVMNHIAFRLPSFAPLEAAGFMLERSANFPGVASVRSPEGERVEVFEDTAPNVGFTQAQGYHDATAERHNKPVSTPIALHHIHFYVPEGAVSEAQAWYVRLFGGIPGKRDVYDAVDLPGVNLNISSRPAKMAPTKGRMIDHLGLEVSKLDAFCHRVSGLGIKFDAPCARDAAGIVRARLTDPWGTTIELTDGLRRY